MVCLRSFRESAHYGATKTEQTPKDYKRENVRERESLPGERTKKQQARERLRWRRGKNDRKREGEAERRRMRETSRDRGTKKTRKIWTRSESNRMIENQKNVKQEVKGGERCRAKSGQIERERDMENIYIYIYTVKLKTGPRFGVL